jgi:hypothetical protein
VYNNAIQLQHESYRDGVKGGGQAGETVQAAKAHTEMAERMRSAGVGYANTVNLAQDLAAWDKAKASGSMAGFAAYALGNYDSSADFWRMTADGNVIFDKSKHLYDENGNLLKEYTGEGGYTASLADVMGISLKEAENMLGHLKWDGNTGTFRTESGQDIYNNKEYAINTPEAVKARYNIQMNYIDQVFESYGGNMLDTANAYINAKVYPPIYSLMDAMTNDEYLLLEFARDYNRILYGDENGQFIPGEGGLWDKTKFRAYTSEAGVNAVEEIKRSLTGGPYNDANPLYTHMGKEGVLYPLDTQATKTSTLSHYEDGRRHGWGSPAGLAIDISALNKDVMSIKGNFVFTQQYETLLGNSVSYNESKEQGYGQSLVTFTPDSTQIYGHFLIAENNNRSARVKMLVDQMTASNIWRVVIPPGTAVGDVGTTGHSTGIHAHIE